ncbi:MAG TPA: hypothetical protein DD435_04355 [Cyanobacteria bacterium UBA8530]|nr:hypothetical protein [Cyanobacteria bacterium UBA8530]
MVVLDNKKKRLGEVLVEGEWINSSHLSQALSEQKQTNEKLGEILVRLGVLSGMELKAVLASNADLDTAPMGEGVRQRLGDLLLKSKRINQGQLGRALEVQKQTNEKIGAVLVRFGLISENELTAVLTWQEDCSKSAPHAVKLLLGEILVATDIISRDQLVEVLKQQKLTKRQIGDILVDTGFVKPKQINEALKIQSKLISAALVAMLSMSALTGCGSSSPLVPTGGSGDVRLQYGSQPSIQQVLPNAGYTSNFKTGAQNVQPVALRSGVSLLTNGSTWAMLDKFPYVAQATDNTCAQATMSMVMAYWGAGGANVSDMQGTYQSVVNQNNKHNLPTNNDTIRRYLTSKGLQVQDYKNGNINFVKSLIDKGHAPIVLLDYGQLSEHYVVVVGYDLNRTVNGSTEKGVVYLHDSVERAYTPMSIEDFTEKWQNKSMTGLPLVGGDKYAGLMFDVSK